MRKLALTSVLAAAIFASLSASSLAAFTPHFDVVSKLKGGHETPNGFVFAEKLVDPANPKNKVGFDRGVCKPTGRRAAFCRVVYHLDGEVGGHGKIRASGGLNARTGDQRLNVNGGSGAFEGAAGKVLLLESELGPRYGVNEFHLVR